ncbi:unnamed protein product [Meganyctiphanes norvegica]|uniref:Uncharacterized protein n=1 Tax=Meganyctiphanes norvegica TaxID=48144 RepID=A0AAV2RMH6_MEGNR
MLVPQQLNVSCDICCNISGSINKPNSSCSLIKIEEGDCSTIITCYHCHGEMASIPHSMQMVKSQRKRYNQASFSKAPITGYSDDMVDKPNRYNSKKMNAIWGMYNKDSVHNFKSMACDAVTEPEIRAVAHGADYADMLLDNQDMYKQQQFQQLDHGKHRGMFGELGKAVSANFLENIYHYI